jgi:hypothetical protein
MARQPQAQLLLKEGRISLALSSFKFNPCQSLRKLAAAYNVPRATLQTRLNGTLPHHEITSVQRKLSPVEEQSLVRWILDLDCRGFPP